MEWSLSERWFRRWDESSALVEHEDYAELPRNQTFLDELRYFFGCVSRREPADVTIREGAASLRIALGLLQSQKSGHAVEFEKSSGS
jgi:predicted dehydrogenase